MTKKIINIGLPSKGRLKHDTIKVFKGMAAYGYDTCPMEGFDSLRAKRILKLPNSSEINMIISCGKRSEKGVYGPRFRIPFDEIYFRK